VFFFGIIILKWFFSSFLKISSRVRFKVRLPDGTIATFDPNTLTATVKDDPPRYKATVRGTIVGKERDTTKRVTCTKNCTVDAQGRLHGPKVSVVY
jgi:hypothetical protein